MSTQLFDARTWVAQMLDRFARLHEQQLLEAGPPDPPETYAEKVERWRTGNR
jgi:hypothetical protein